MAAALRAHPIAVGCCSLTGKPEQSLFWVDPATGVWRRRGLDWLPEQHSTGRLILADYKTGKTASPTLLERSLYDYGYHIQAAWYLDGVTALGLARDAAFLLITRRRRRRTWSPSSNPTRWRYGIGRPPQPAGPRDLPRLHRQGAGRATATTSNSSLPRWIENRFLEETCDRRPRPCRSARGPAPGRLGQATAIEQSRAVAEVQAAIVVAQQCPRNVQVAMAEMRVLHARWRSPSGRSTATRAGARPSPARPSTWPASWRAAGATSSTASPSCAATTTTASPRCIAFAWDVQTNTRNSTHVHRPAQARQARRPRGLTDMRDIYENNANNGARRLREAIFAILPPWFVADAKSGCATRPWPAAAGSRSRSASPTPSRRTAVAAWSRTSWSEARPASPISWTEHDVAQLSVIYQVAGPGRGHGGAGVPAAAGNRRRDRRHGDTPAPNCRGCGTNSRAVQAAAGAAARQPPPWCGTCDETTRQVETDDGRPARCPRCHPLVVRKETTTP
jgi:hypothetical protein